MVSVISFDKMDFVLVRVDRLVVFGRCGCLSWWMVDLLGCRGSLNSIRKNNLWSRSSFRFGSPPMLISMGCVYPRRRDVCNKFILLIVLPSPRTENPAEKPAEMKNMFTMEHVRHQIFW